MLFKVPDMTRRNLLFYALLMALPAMAERPVKLSKTQCKALARRIRKLESRLRDGHSARQGRSLNRQKRELQLQRFRGCR